MPGCARRARRSTVAPYTVARCTFPWLLSGIDKARMRACERPCRRARVGQRTILTPTSSAVTSAFSISAIESGASACGGWRQFHSTTECVSSNSWCSLRTFSIRRVDVQQITIYRAMPRNGTRCWVQRVSRPAVARGAACSACRGPQWHAVLRAARAEARSGTMNCTGESQLETTASASPQNVVGSAGCGRTNATSASGRHFCEHRLTPKSRAS
jgi:hypothetical protein